MAGKYKYVYPLKRTRASKNTKPLFQGSIWDKEESRYRTKTFQCERKAALWVDKVLIQMNREPVNILKRV